MILFIIGVVNMALVKCPRCELNYMKDTEKYCSVCLNEIQGDIKNDDVELCQICNQFPCLPGKDICKFCLNEMKSSAAIDDTDNVTDDEIVENDDEKLDEIETVDTVDELHEGEFDLVDTIPLDMLDDEENENLEDEDEYSEE